MTKVKISVVKSFSKKDVFGDELPDGLKGPLDVCDTHRPGQEFFFDGSGCPEGLCNWAYSDIQKEIVHIYHGGDNHWIEEPGVGYAACTDGMKPVLFRIERVED